MLIVSVDHFININGEYYCKPYSLLSLSQYWDVCSNVKLLGNQMLGAIIPDGWVSIPNRVIFYPINEINSLNPFERKKIKNNIWNFIKDERVVYLRMPDYRVLEVYKMIKDKVPFFCEFHGDWEEALLAQKLNKTGFKNKIKAFFADYRAQKARKYYKEISRNSIANISIGTRLIEKYGFDEKPSLATTNHIIFEKMIFGRTNFSLEEDTLKLVFVGELQHRKGIAYLINALKNLKNNGNVNFNLSIIGVGYLEQELKAMVKENELEREIEFRGAIYDRKILEAEYKKANVFVLPSIAGEGVPRVLQEAQAFGCAIIATDIGSTFWQLQNDSGLLVEPNNIKALESAILAMYDDNRRKELSLNATQNAYKFTYEKQREGIKSFLNTHLREYIHD